MTRSASTSTTRMSSTGPSPNQGSRRPPKRTAWRCAKTAEWSQDRVKARLYLDEDVIPEVARLLRARGIDVISVHEVGATGLSDEQQLERATAEDRVLLTNNYRDF